MSEIKKRKRNRSEKKEAKKEKEVLRAFRDIFVEDELSDEEFNKRKKILKGYGIDVFRF